RKWLSTMSMRSPLHRRVVVFSTERRGSESGAGNVEIEGEMLADGLRIAQEALQRVAGVERVGPVAGPERLDRLARLRDGERILRPPAQLGLEARHLILFRQVLETHGGVA